jgi:hypothetical protein
VRRRCRASDVYEMGHGGGVGGGSLSLMMLVRAMGVEG